MMTAHVHNFNDPYTVATLALALALAMVTIVTMVKWQL